jgi:hypothetical protein
MSSSPAMAREMLWVTSKACQRLLDPNAVTAQLTLAKYVIKGSPGFSIFVPGDLHTNNLGDFLAVRYNTVLILNPKSTVARYRTCGGHRIYLQSKEY